jgi:hypothetical protein
MLPLVPEAEDRDEADRLRYEVDGPLFDIFVKSETYKVVL